MKDEKTPENPAESGGVFQKGIGMKSSSRTPLLNVRALATLSTGLSFLVMTVSGIVLYVAPRGRYANWVDWNVAGMAKAEWAAIHMTFSLLLLTAVIVHLWFNWRALRNYVIKRASAQRFRLRELLIATVVCLLLFAGTLLEAPLLRGIKEINTRIKDYWEEVGDENKDGRPRTERRGRER